jgi:hypothetical protein
MVSIPIFFSLRGAFWAGQGPRERHKRTGLRQSFLDALKEAFSSGHDWMKIELVFRDLGKGEAEHCVKEKYTFA